MVVVGSDLSAAFKKLFDLRPAEAQLFGERTLIG